MRIYSATYQYNSEVGSRADNGACTIVGLISEGRTFRVFKARTGTKFVILKAPVNIDAMSVELLRREYELCKDLSHPCIVSIVDFMENSPVGPAIVMEFIDGFTLDEFVAHGATKAQRKAVLMDILDGVDYLHHRGILHNDLKPDNIIVNSNGAARIIDFGLSASGDSAYGGCIGGSDAFTAPEIMRDGTPAGAASDIYSVGLLIRLLFGGMRYNSVAARCSKINPAKRYSSISELKRALNRKDAFPWITATVSILLLAAVVAMPYVMQQTKKMKVNRIEQEFEAETAPNYEDVIHRIKQQEYQEFARILEARYIEYTTAKVNALQKMHPISESGEISPEVLVFCDITRKQQEYIESIVNVLPSMFDETLPPAEMEALSNQFNDFVATTESLYCK